VIITRCFGYMVQSLKMWFAITSGKAKGDGERFKVD
jgi:hypothetical protein